MYIDPVVKEVRDNGARLAEECGGDVHRVAERLRQEQLQHADRIVRRGKRLPSTEKNAQTRQP